jgi:hypothetical protein
VAHRFDQRPPFPSVQTPHRLAFSAASMPWRAAFKQFHFSQRDAIFEIGWAEFGHDLELRVHIEPAVREGDD